MAHWVRGWKYVDTMITDEYEDSQRKIIITGVIFMLSNVNLPSNSVVVPYSYTQNHPNTIIPPAITSCSMLP